jgi:glycosyltransferase involved in cell wall biosynthesis
MAVSRILKLNNVKKTINYLKKNGISHTYYAAKERMEEEKKDIYVYREPAEEELLRQRQESARYPYLFSIVVPAYETKEEFLREMIASVQRQSYPKWELIIVDASDSDTVKKVVREMAESGSHTEPAVPQSEIGVVYTSKTDSPILYWHLPHNLGISGNTNVGIELAEGDYIALLDHDDFITPDALYQMAREIAMAEADGVKPALLYSDEDKYDEKEKRYVTPHIKYKFNFDLILSNNYICHFMAVETRMMKRLKLRSGFDGAQDYDLVLRVVDRLCHGTEQSKQLTAIRHIPRILYHWRCHEGSTAGNTASKDYAYEAGKRAVADFCVQQGWHANVEHSLHLGFYDISYQPDILTVRQDVGIVGGRILDRRRRICGGAYDRQGKCLYEGLHWKYSGAAHRAVLKQDCAAVDVRCMRLQPKLRAAYTQITGLPYRERTIRVRTPYGTENVDIVDVSGLSCDEAGYRKLSLELGRVAENMKYRVLFNTDITMMGE